MHHYLATIILFSCGMVGCASNARIDYRFKVVDAVTKTPLPAVHLRVWGHGHYFDNRLFPGEELRPDAVSDSKGELVARGLVAGPGWEFYLTFTHTGYETLLLTGDAADPLTTWEVYYKEPDRVPSKTLDASERKLSPSEINIIELRSKHDENEDRSNPGF